jgi:hypothetical protein
MQSNRNLEHLPKIILFGTLFSALTASFVVILQEFIWKRKNKRLVQIEDKKEEQSGKNENVTLQKVNFHGLSSTKFTTTPEQRMYRLEKDGSKSSSIELPYLFQEISLLLNILILEEANIG